MGFVIKTHWRREYRRRLPRRRIPDISIFITVHRNLVDHGRFRRAHQGRPNSDHELENATNLLDNNPQINKR